MLQGGQWELSMWNNLVTFGFAGLAIMTLDWRLGIGAAFFAWPVQWLIRLIGKKDPQYWQVYWRYLRQPSIREAHGRP